MRYSNGKVYASRKVARFWRPILQPIVDFVGGFLEITIPHLWAVCALVIAAQITIELGGR